MLARKLGRTLGSLLGKDRPPSPVVCTRALEFVNLVYS
jgi:hypothetical protein